jgi:mono/diheme cytochrome c family protein
MYLGKSVTLAAFCFLSLATKGQHKTELQLSIGRGKIVYEQNCLSCHQSDGTGVPQLTPPLVKTSFTLGDKGRLIDIVLKGLKNVDIDGEGYENPMPAFESLTDQKIADVLTYVRNNFGNVASMVKAEEVAKERKNK